MTAVQLQQYARIEELARLRCKHLQPPVLSAVDAARLKVAET